MTSYILTLKCPNRPGVVAETTGHITSAGGDITEAAQYQDPLSGTFLARIRFETKNGGDGLKQAFGDLARHFDMSWDLRPADYRPKVLIMVSKFDHCMGDLLYRTRLGELKMEIVGIIGNHPEDVLNTPLHRGYPYHHLPITKDTKPQQEAEVKRIVNETGAELIVLARYMQILSDDLSAFLAGRCINIHHSFLPGFKGAKPYHQAHARGVKMIGATSHYVTEDLDEGPIIYQDVETVSHADTPDDLIEKGRDIERRVLARAVRLHIERRVMLDGARTVVFAK